MKKQLLLGLLTLITFNVIAQTNLVPNNDFENWSSLNSTPDDWGLLISNGNWEQSADAQNGVSSLQLDIATDKTFSFIFSELENVSLTSEATYVCTFYYKVVSGTFTKVEFKIEPTNIFSTDLIIMPFTDFSTTEWKKGEFEYTPTATTTEDIQVNIRITGDAGAKMLIDNVSIIEKSVLSTSDLSIDSNRFSVSPNPMRSNEIMSFNRMVDVVLFDISGRKIISANNVKALKIPNLKVGTYFIQTNLGITKKLIVR